MLRNDYRRATVFVCAQSTSKSQGKWFILAPDVVMIYIHSDRLKALAARVVEHTSVWRCFCFIFYIQCGYLGSS